MKKLFTILFLGLGLGLLGGLGGGLEAQGTNTYSTNFPLTENPISEGGRWINGETVGLDWKNVRTRPGLAYGGDPSGTPINYNDPTAILTGNWGPDQTVQATVYTVNQQSGQINEEVEIRLRSTLTAHSNRGYEVLFRCTPASIQYIEIVRWNGPAGNFTYITRGGGPGLKTGDVVKATIIGNVIRGYINDVQVIQGTDNTYTTGNPGMGFWLNRAPNLNADYGFTSFSASDSGNALPSAPTGLRILSSELARMQSAGLALFFPGFVKQTR